MGTSSKWFHPNTTDVQAEKMLINNGSDGSFLACPSNSNPGDLTLLVRKNEEVIHIKVQNTGNYHNLFRDEKFATLAELGQFYMENRAKLKGSSGDVIELKYPLVCADPTIECCFHGPLSGTEAERILMDKSKCGSFLVRESQSKLGDFELSVRTDDNVTHIMIPCQDGKYVGDEKFCSIVDLVENYKNNHVVDIAGKVIYLKMPLNATSITASTIKSRVQQLAKDSQGSSNTGFWKEFDYLQHQEGMYLYSRKEGQKPENRLKNKYKNILPFDHTRVTLKDVDPNVPTSDYINANIITPGEDYVGKGAKKYIATQACLSNTVTDFWWMIWQEHTQVIVMCTNIKRKGKRNKLVQYWPDENETKQCGKFTIKNFIESTRKDYVLREFSLNKENCPETHKIYHYHFTAWPDHGVPSDPDCVLNFLRDVNHRQESVSSAGPIVVHCSSGIGRTGTLIIIDMIVDRIKRQGLDTEIDIQRSIHLVRSQRSGMVQCEAQYKFIYLAVKHCLDSLQQKIQAEEGTSSERDVQLASRLLNFSVYIKGSVLPLETETIAYIKNALQFELGVPSHTLELYGWIMNFIEDIGHIKDDTILSALHLPQITTIFILTPSDMNLTVDRMGLSNLPEQKHTLHIIDTTQNKEYYFEFPESKTVLGEAIITVMHAELHTLSSEKDVQFASRQLKFAVLYKGNVVLIEVPDTETVASIKNELYFEIGVPPSRQEFCGWLINHIEEIGHITDDTVLASLHLPEITTIFLLTPGDINLTVDGMGLSNHLEQKNRLHIIDTTNFKDYLFEFGGNKTVQEVKQMMVNVTGIALRSQWWIGWPDTMINENVSLFLAKI